MEAKHTPGPWEFVEWSGHRSISADDSACGFCITVNGYRLPLCDLEGDLDECEANARLMAAAPDLLEALLDCRRALELANFTGELAVVDAAISKALPLNASLSGQPCCIKTDAEK